MIASRERPGGRGVARTAPSSRSAGSGWPSSAPPARSPGCRWGRTPGCRPASIVREDSLTLYGFADDDERQLFELLQTANGVGPRLAQAVLAIHPPREVRRAVSMADVKALMQVPGIGKKGAERLILELRDRLGVDDVGHLARRPARRRPAVGHPGRAVAGPADLRAGRPRLERQGGRRRDRPARARSLTSRSPRTGSVEIAILLRQALQLLGRS